MIDSYLFKVNMKLFNKSDFYSAFTRLMDWLTDRLFMY